MRAKRLFSTILLLTLCLTAIHHNRARTTQSDPWLEIMLEDINKKKNEVEHYDPSERSQLVTRSTPDFFTMAISARARAAYYKQERVNETRKSALNAALDSLAASAAKKLSLYKPSATLFAFRNQPAEQLMIRILQNATTIKVHRIGLKEADWLIEKNAFGIPLDRYKHGFIWVRDSNDEHPYCHLYTVHVQQNYAGGGGYGPTFARVSDDEIFGCP